MHLTGLLTTVLATSSDPVELGADCAADMPGRPATARFPDGQAADDGRLVRAARGGERAAFAALYDRYARVVHGVLLARVARDDVDDLGAGCLSGSVAPARRPARSGRVRRLARR